MTKSRRILVVDAPSGPEPAFYGPLLPPDADVRVVTAVVGDPCATAARATTLRQWFQVDIVEERALLERAIVEIGRTWQAHGVLAFSEYVVHTAAAAARALGLPANGETAQLALFDKHAQRTALRRNGVPGPEFMLVETPDDLEIALRTVGLPAVLKPVTGMGSLAVFRVESSGKLKTTYREALAMYSRDPRVAGRRPSFLLEQELIGETWHPDRRIGDYVAVDSLVGRGRIVHLAVQDKLPLAYPFRETGHVLPSTLPSHLQQQLLEITERAIRALGIGLGAVQTEIKLTKNGPRILEVNGRCGGAIPNMVYDAGRYNQIAEMARISLGLAPRLPPRFEQYSAYLTPQPPAEDVRITRAPTVHELLQVPHVTSAEVMAAAGARPDWRAGTRANLARVSAVSKAWDDLIQLAELLSDGPFFHYETAAPVR